jgi:Arc/MetJ-type ribon-helix-helix transcriptional regulator
VHCIADRIPFCYIVAVGQLVTRVDDALLRDLDLLVADGVVESRSAAVRAALVDLLDRHRRQAVGHAIVEGYRRVPQTQADGAPSDEATRRMIAQEPW